jgi:serine/threonine protein kinase
MTCQSCGATLDGITAKVLCPACMLRSVLEAAPDERASVRRLALPRTFGPYELMEEIGRGGMGVVYLARQPALDRLVAVKLLLSGAYSNEVALRRFQVEAAAAAGLQEIPSILQNLNPGSRCRPKAARVHKILAFCPSPHARTRPPVH